MKKRRNNKAQIVGEVLIYILAIVVFSLTILYGYKAVKYFTERSTEISFLELENKAKNDIERVKSDTYGTVKKSTLIIPGKYEKVCFVTSFDTNAYPNGMASPYSLINNDVKTAKNKNMFLAPPGSAGFNIGEIEVDNLQNWVCIDVQGSKITLRLESMGDHVKVSKW